MLKLHQALGSCVFALFCQFKSYDPIQRLVKRLPNFPTSPAPHKLDQAKTLDGYRRLFTRLDARLFGLARYRVSGLFDGKCEPRMTSRASQVGKVVIDSKKYRRMTIGTGDTTHG
jgi:hypothetical protein